MNKPSSAHHSALKTTRHKEHVRKRRRYQQQTAERYAKGLCPKCGKEELAPGRRLCDPCGAKRRKAERARYAAGKAAGKLYGGKDPNLCRRIARKKSKERFHTRRDSGLCTRCGHRPLVAGSTTCEPCSDVRRAADREQYDKRRSDGLCGRCGGTTAMTAAHAVAHARCSRPGAINRKMQPAVSATPGGAHAGVAPTVERHRRGPHVVRPAPAAPICARVNIAAYRFIRRATPSSKSRRAKITAHSKVGPM